MQKGDDIRSYWEEFYRNARLGELEVPSQFAAFFLLEAWERELIIEIGCGNGRDSLFFALSGKPVIGIDWSESAIAACRERATRLGVRDAEFWQEAMESPDLAPRLAARRAQVKSCAVYARFFLHAIDETREDAFFRQVAGVCAPGDLVALEFRTRRDLHLNKVTGAHFRRFIDPVDVLAKARGFGFETRYFVEGFGYAKFRSDDAHVARVILEKTESN